jgi:hypothetical protein
MSKCRGFQQTRVFGNHRCKGHLNFLYSTRHVKSEGTGAPTTGIGCTGVLDRDGIRTPIQNWRGCSRSNTDVVATAGCSSNMTIGLRWITLMGIAAMCATPICKRFMDTVTMRRRGNRGTTSRQVCGTSIRTLRSGVRGNNHAPFWISGRWSDPPTD